MTSNVLIKKGSNFLKKNKIKSHVIDAEILLSSISGESREKFLLKSNLEMSQKQIKSFDNLITRRALKKEPVAYLINKKEFWSINFNVDRDVLIPRPETELLIDRCLYNIPKSSNIKLSVLDIGTGSGIIAIILKLMSPLLTVNALDISKEAINLTKKNIELHNLDGKINLFNEDFRDHLSMKYDFILANLPYIPKNRFPSLPPELKFEPRLALDGGENGIELITDLIKLLPKIVKGTDSKVILEIDSTQLKYVKNIINIYLKSAKILSLKDLSGKDRIVEISNIK